MSAFLKGKKILIAGAGIGGLSCALALGARGAFVEMYERRGKSSEEGAGIQIGPNGMRVLHALGVAERLRENAGVPDSIIAHDGRSGNVLATLPLGRWLAQRHGAPYWVLHRADLHRALRQAVSENSRITIQSGVEVDGLETTRDGASACSGGQQLGRGEVLVSADGLHSKIRKLGFSQDHPRFSGMTASRAVVQMCDVPDRVVKNSISVWLLPHGHVVHYPVRGGREFSIVVIRRSDNAIEGWGAGAPPEKVNDAVSGFAPQLRELVAVASQWRSWSLYRLPVLENLVLGRVVLLGDSAHPVLPFLAQGGAMALEDAVVLADELSREANVERALAAFERQRRSRVERVRAASERNGRIYHLGGALGIARNAVMQLVPGSWLMAQYDWLYSWRDFEEV